MSSTKYLADLLKVCSVLPIFAVMPAMANENIVVEDEAMTFEDKVIKYETTDTTSALGVNATGATQVDFNGTLTDISVNSTGSPKYTAPVFNRGAGTVINFNSDKTELSATSANSHIQGVAVNNDGSEVNFNGDLEMNLSGNSSGKVIRGFDVTDDGYVSLNGDAVLNVTGGEDVVEVLGILSSGAKGIDLKSGNSLKIDAKGKTSVTGIYSQYGGDIDFAKDTDVDVKVNATDGTARGVFSSYYSGSAGNIDSKGSLDVTVSGSDAIGLSVVRGGSADIKHMNIDVTGTNSAKGIFVSDYHEEGDDIGTAETTDVTVGTEGSTTKIVAKGAEETIGIHVKKVEEDVELTLNGDVDIESDGVGVLASDGAVANIGTEGAKEIKISGLSSRGARAEYAATLNIGSKDVENINVSSEQGQAVIALYEGSLLNITGQNVDISNNSGDWATVHVGNNVLTENNDYSKSATVNIVGEDVVISNKAVGGSAVAGMSQGVVNIEGNTTISAEKAIVARGEAKVNINKSGEHTVKMLGDIAFDYDKETSGSAVDAFVDVTLAGKESFWTGNMKASYGSGKPADASYLEVNSAKLTMKDGAVWNATKIVDSGDETSGVMYAALNDLVIDGGTVNIADTERGITVDRIVANDAVFNGSILNVNESIKIESGLTTFKSDVMGRAANAEEGIEAATLTLDSGATMDIGTSTLQFDTMNIDGTVIASVTNGSPYGRLYGEIVAGDDALLQLNVGSVGIYKIFNTVTDMAINAGATYDVINNGVDGIVVATKSIAAIADDAGISTPAAGIVAGLANSQDATLQKVSLAMQEVLNSGDIATVERETKKLNPTDNPVTQAVATSVQSTVSSLASNRMSMPSVGRSGGDVNFTSGAVWAQGLYNKTKMNDQFNGYTRGIAAGIDGTLDNDITVGAGYAFNHSDIALSSRNTDIDSHTVFLYGQYKPSEWFVNTTLNYTLSDYAENVDALGVAVVSDYKTDAFGAQLMTGYDFDSGITPEFGLRYLHVNGVTYQNSLGIESALNSADYLTAMLGTKYGFDVVASDEVLFRPELRYAVKYDMVSDETSATVAMPGVAAYTVNGDRLSRVGAEFGIGLTMKYKEFDMSLSYDIDVREGYTSQTGMLKLRAEF